MEASQGIDDLLKCLDMDSHAVHQLARELTSTFRHLSAESLNQFLPTPITESMLRPAGGRDRGRYGGVILSSAAKDRCTTLTCFCSPVPCTPAI